MSSYFGVVEVASTKTAPTPGWAYVPDTGPQAAAAAVQPSNRKRAARFSQGHGLGLADQSARQDARTRKELEALDRDSYRDAAIPIPARPGGGKASKSTPNVRKILQSQKSFANHLDDYQAFVALAEANPTAAAAAGLLLPASAGQPALLNNPGLAAALGQAGKGGGASGSGLAAKTSAMKGGRATPAKASKEAAATPSIVGTSFFPNRPMSAKRAAAIEKAEAAAKALARKNHKRYTPGLVAAKMVFEDDDDEDEAMTDAPPPPVAAGASGDAGLSAADELVAAEAGSVGGEAGGLFVTSRPGAQYTGNLDEASQTADKPQATQQEQQSQDNQQPPTEKQHEQPQPQPQPQQPQQPCEAPPSYPPDGKILPAYQRPPPPPHPGDSDPLLMSAVPPFPSDEELRALMTALPLSYLEARATLPGPAGTDDGGGTGGLMTSYPARVFCDVCGYWGRVRCIKCGTRVCALDCLNVHREDCITRYGL